MDFLDIMKKPYHHLKNERLITGAWMKLKQTDHTMSSTFPMKVRHQEE
jgi:hypothetical protein